MTAEHDVVTAGAPAPRAASTRPLALRPGVLAPALAGALCLVLTVIAWRVFVTTTRGQLVEEAARLGSASTRDELAWLTGPALDLVSVPLLGAVVVAAVLVSLVQRRWSVAIAVIVLLSGSNLTTQALQDALERPLPDASAIHLNSFPSGHATVGASIAAAALLVAPVRWRPGVALVGVLLTAGLGLSTMVGNDVGAWHRGSDVAAAILIVATWYFVVEIALAVAAGREAGPTAPRAPRVPRRLLHAAGGLSLAVALAALTATAIRVPITTPFGEQVAFAGSVAGVVATACFVGALMLRLRPHHPGGRVASTDVPTDLAPSSPGPSGPAL